jgi:hypothetical protein
MQKKVEYLESTLINLQRIVKTQEPVEVYIQNIEKGLEVIEDLKSMIEYVLKIYRMKLKR